MSQPPLPPFPPRFAGGPPQPLRFPPGPFHGPPRPAFLPPAFPPFPPPPPWQPRQQPPPLPWRPLQAAERPCLAPGSSGGWEGSQRVGSGEEKGEEEPWLRRFLARSRAATEEKEKKPPPPPPEAPPLDLGQAALEALRGVARVSALCRAWRERGDEAEAEEIAEAEAELAALREAVEPLRGRQEAEEERSRQRRLERGRKKRLRRRKQKRAAREARGEEQARRAEEAARIEGWRVRRAQEVEDRRREEELKAAADSVLSEVRKKQADAKRMAEILRGLEKLRKLRKEAAGRKGVCPPAAADEAFESEVQRLRASLKARTELYEAEERALRVMLEGEQEEERKRDLEKKQRKERETLLQQKRQLEAKLFGDPDEFSLGHILKPFTQYYLQAEYSVPALIQIRHEWDRFLVPADHPEGQGIPPGWVLPSPPSSDIWTTAVR